MIATQIALILVSTLLIAAALASRPLLAGVS